MKLDYYKVVVTKGSKCTVHHYGLPYKQIINEVNQHYHKGADAVEIEMITKEELDDQLPKP